MGISDALVSGSSQIQQGAGKKIEASASRVSLTSNSAGPPRRETRAHYRRITVGDITENTYVFLRRPLLVPPASLPAPFERNFTRGGRHNRITEIKSMNVFLDYAACLIAPLAYSCARKEPAETLAVRKMRLQNSLLLLFLAGDAVTRPRHSFEALLLQFLVAGATFAELFVLNSRERSFNECQ